MSVKIQTDGVLSKFADLVVANAYRVYRLTLISPWIGSSDVATDPVLRLTEAIQGKSCTLLIITRPPVLVWHARALASLRRHKNCEVFGCASLHMKLYLLECNGFRAAVFGSANLTPAADTENRELAIEFRSTKEGSDDPTAALINLLLTHASYLRNQSDVVLLN